MTKDELVAAINVAAGYDTKEARQVFADAITHGTGWLETKIDSDGTPRLMRVDPLETLADRITPDQIEEIASAPWAFASSHISRALRQQAADIVRLRANAKPEERK